LTDSNRICFFHENRLSTNAVFMKTIVISSQKGGSAKSTLAALLSVEAERAGDGPAWLVDTDQQGTLSRWHERREAERPQRAAIAFKGLAAGLAAIKTKHKGAFCFIDTAPAISDQSAVIIALADLVLIPVQPSPADLWAVAETIELVKQAGKPFRFVITKAKPQTNLTAQAIAALSHHGPVAQQFIVDRVGYAVAMAGGHTAPELTPKGPVAMETAALWQEIKSTFHENIKPAKKVVHA
jgi:chromosome partitioning protein